ncbi:MAG: HIT family protein [Lachnospiraceae bacterium]|nr:HIT family protein [Lachnospiraceae bacterium]
MCGICERIKETKAGNNPFFVKELETGYVVIGDYQHFKGYTLFLYKDHVVELFDLDEKTRAKNLYEMTVVAEAVKNAFGAEKMNYECLGNGEGGAHIHWHLFPRRTGDIEGFGNNGRGPVWWYPMEKMYADRNRPENEELEKLKAKLLEELNKLSIDSIKSRTT